MGPADSQRISELEEVSRRADVLADLQGCIEDLERWKQRRESKRLDVRSLNRALSHLRRLERDLEQ